MRRVARAVAALAMIATATGCESWQDRVGTGVSVDLQYGQLRLSRVLGCWLPSSWTGENLITLSSLRMLAVRILGDEGENARRYEADVELTVDTALSSPKVLGLSRAPVRVTVTGVVTHETKLRFMYIVPWIFAETRANTFLLTRNGVPVVIERGGEMFAPLKVDTLATLSPGDSTTGSFAQTMKMSDEQESSTTVYDVVRLRGRAGKKLHVEISSHTPTVLGAQLLPPEESYAVSLLANVIPKSGTLQLDYVTPADGDLRLVVWKMKLDPAGSYDVRYTSP